MAVPVYEMGGSAQNLFDNNQASQSSVLKIKQS